MSAVKEHGMLFKAEMVRKLLDKVAPKTQTRRPITFDNSITVPRITRKQWPELQWDMAVLGYDNGVPFWYVPRPNSPVIKVSPRIQPEDIIWVRECWRFLGTDMNRLGRNRPEQDGVFMYRADKQRRTITRPFMDIEKYMVGHIKWRSSMLMPRWASRIDLNVLQMRSERIQEISGEDARAEGVSLNNYRCMRSPKVYIYEFSRLWDSINFSRGYGWETNHPVWIHDFEDKTS